MISLVNKNHYNLLMSVNALQVHTYMLLKVHSLHLINSIHHLNIAPILTLTLQVLRSHLMVLFLVASLLIMQLQLLIQTTNGQLFLTKIKEHFSLTQELKQQMMPLLTTSLLKEKPEDIQLISQSLIVADLNIHLVYNLYMNIFI